jgi:L-ascorbate metabolism protein UlaG (beta-lactamase superfamily)
MKITYLGHAAFELVLENGTSLVFDPYESGAYDGALGYGPITGAYDIAVVSHEHADHCCESVKSEAGAVVDEAGDHEIAGITITSYPTFHDESKGSERGKNLISIVEADGLRIAHLGDLGHPVTAADVPGLEGVDVLFIPVGGHFTIDAKTAADLVASFNPRVVIPMHFKTDKVGFPISPVDEFTKLMERVEEADESVFTVSKESLPDIPTVVVLDPAL